MDEVDRYIPARNARGPGEGIAPKHALKWAQYSPEWYRACDEAYVNRMRKVLGLEPEDPRERASRLHRQAIEAGEYVE
jgi:hypothetical protein